MQLHLQPTYNVQQQPDTVETFICYQRDERANPIAFHSRWYSQPFPEALSNRCLSLCALKLLCTKRRWKEEEIPDLKHVPPFQIKIPCDLTLQQNHSQESLIKSSTHYLPCRQALLTLKLKTS